MGKKRQVASIRLIGTKTEISGILTAFSDKGFSWKSNEHFYARVGQPDFYSYYLENFEYASI
jgi:hypothetical protein